MEPSPPPESQSQGAFSTSDISVLSTSSTTTTATGSTLQTSNPRGGNRKRKQRGANGDPPLPDPLDDEGTRGVHLLNARNEPATHLAPAYRNFDPQKHWPNQSRNELHLYGLAVKLPVEVEGPFPKEGWHFVCMASEKCRAKARQGVGAVEMVEFYNAISSKVEVKSHLVTAHLKDSHGMETKTKAKLAAREAGDKEMQQCLAKATEGSNPKHLPLIITRGNNVYGPPQYTEKIIPKFVNLLMRDRPVTLHGNGLNTRNFLFVRMLLSLPCYPPALPLPLPRINLSSSHHLLPSLPLFPSRQVEDVARAFEVILHRGVTGKIYNIGGTNEKANVEVAKDLIRLMGHGKAEEKMLQFVEDRVFNGRRLSVLLFPRHASSSLNIFYPLPFPFLLSLPRSQAIVDIDVTNCNSCFLCSSAFRSLKLIEMSYFRS